MISFWYGFEKQAGFKDVVKGIPPGIVMMYGSLLGAVGGSVIAVKAADKSLKKLQNSATADAKKEFNKLKSVLPKGSMILTPNDVNKLLKHKDLESADKTLLTFVRDQLKRGNALSSHPAMGGFKNLPGKYKNKPLIISSEKIDPSVMVHEAGHLIDFEQASKKPTLKRLYNRYIRTTISKEEAAWDKAPGKYDQKIKEEMLGTYIRGRNYSLGGLIGGGLLASLIHSYVKRKL